MNMESMIAGKMHSEILSMTKQKRSLWYKMILPEEKEKAMKLLEVIKRTKQSAWWTLERRVEQSARMTGKNNPMYGRTGEDCPMYGKTGKNASFFGQTHSEETRARIGSSKIGKARSEETRIKISVARVGKYIGKNSGNWKDGASFEPYCLAFNDKRKEYVRNLYSRTCTVCGKSTFQSVSKNGKWIGRLDVDHLDENKMQGCDDWEWRLTTLCRSCHGRMSNKRNHLLLELLLNNNKRHQTNFLFGDEI